MLRRHHWARRSELLDPVRDSHEISLHVSAYDFPWDNLQALSFALFRTYAVPSIGRLLDETGEFTDHVQKRYDDTGLLLEEVQKHGFGHERGRAAVRRINQMHGYYDISDDDFRYVLATFVVVPKRWLDDYGFRSMTPHEVAATTNYYRELGRHMNIKDLPADFAGFERLLDDYEAAHFAFDAGGRRVADATLDLMTTFPPSSWLPAWLAKRFAFALMDEPLLRAFRYPGVSRVERVLFRSGMRLRARLLRFFPARSTPKWVEQFGYFRTYPAGYEIGDLGTFHDRRPAARPEAVTPADPAARPPRGGTRALLAVATLFAANGLAVGVFGGTLPGQQARLDLSRIELTGLLVAAALVAVVSMNVSGAVADRRGARAPTLVAGVVVLFGSVVMGSAPTYPVALVGAGLFGLGNGAMDVGMNALGVSVEQARGRPVMSRLHACFSVGNFTGALLVVVLGRLLATDPAVHWSFWVGALLVGLLLVGIRPVVPDSLPRPAPATRAPGADGRGSAARVPTVAWLLAAMAVCFGLTEGTGIDWSSLHVAEVGHVSPTTGAWGLACVAGFMVLIRLAGDSVVERLGRALVVRIGAGVALCGYLLTAFTSPLWSILPGWCLVGFGVGLVAPQIYGLAGHVGGGRGLALVVSFGYGAFLVGPAIIGFIASQASLQRAMLVPVVTAVGLVVMSRWMPADPIESELAKQ